MAELIAQGPKPRDRWRRAVPAGQTVVLGRSGAFAVPWDEWISRRHAELTWRDGRLAVRRLPEAGNPIFMRGEEVTGIELKPGEQFVIGETVFSLSQARAGNPPDAVPLLRERTFSTEELEKIEFRDAPHRIDVLSRLPEVISGITDDAELFVRLVNLLLAGIPKADVAALVALERAESTEHRAQSTEHRAQSTEHRAQSGSPLSALRSGPDVGVLHWDRRLATAGGFQPSQRLVAEAVFRRQQTVLHTWGSGEVSGEDAYTPAANLDWAFCTPVRGEACKGWGIYVAGRLVNTPDAASPGSWETAALGDDLKFTELVAAILSSLRQVHLLQRRQASLSHFFSPAVLRSLAEAEPEDALKPREAEVAVLFCDLRGFSRDSEHAQDLRTLLERVSKALGVMTQNILDHGGVIGDFHGDAAMGFWGWPLSQPDAVQRACLAALGIHAVCEASSRRPDHPLTGFRAGVGIASGTAMAGKIGTKDQVKVTVFGPVVNLASRLEGMTKILRAPILVDEATARVIREQLPREAARCRRLAKVRPYGLDSPLVVTELLPPYSEYPLLTDAHLADYEAAVDAVIAGDWPRAMELLHRVPPEDRVKDFLTVFLAQHNRTPPPGWDGVIPLLTKS